MKLNAKVKILLVSLLALSSCRDPKTDRLRFVVEYEFSSDEPSMIPEKEFRASLEEIGFEAFPFGEQEEFDYSIAFSVDYFESPNQFCSMDYNVYYKDTLNCVTLEVMFDGPMDAEKFETGFGILNDQLRKICSDFPDSLKRESLGKTP